MTTTSSLSSNSVPAPGATPGEKAYCAYNRCSGGKNYRGEDCPIWDDLPSDIQTNWEFTTEVMRRHLMKGLNFEDACTKAQSHVGRD